MSEIEEVSEPLTNDLKEFIIQCGKRGYLHAHLLNAFMSVAITVAMQGYVLTDEEKKTLHEILDFHIDRFELIAKKRPNL